MRRSLLPLAVLALAAVAGAQMVTLSPASTGGYVSAHNSVHRGGGTQIWSELETLSCTYTETETTPKGTIYPRTTIVLGWMAEFVLPSVPAGMAVASATLSATVGSGPTQPVFTSVYAGDGAVTLADWRASALGVTTATANPNSSFRIDVSEGVRALYAVGQDQAGLRVGRSSQVTHVEQSLHWSSPKLTVTFAPQAVPEPAPLAALGLGALALMRRRRS